MKQIFATLVFVIVSITPVRAGTESLALLDILKMPETINIMHSEVMQGADSLRDDVLMGRPSEIWDTRVENIFDEKQMLAVFTGEFLTAIGDRDISTLTEFFSSELGQQIVDLELSGRRALLDESVEDAARANLLIAEDDKSPRLKLIRQFSDVNQLIDTNVEGALNSNLAFMRGMQDGGAFGGELTDEQMLMDAWSQEAEIREDTRVWVHSYLLMALGPLSDSDIEAYIELSETTEGQALNNALFIAYEVMFSDLMRQLGLAAAEFGNGDDI